MHHMHLVQPMHPLLHRSGQSVSELHVVLWDSCSLAVGMEEGAPLHVPHGVSKLQHLATLTVSHAGPMGMLVSLQAVPSQPHGEQILASFMLVGGFVSSSLRAHVSFAFS